MKTLIIISTIIFFFTTNMAQNIDFKKNQRDTSIFEKRWNQHPTRKIIIGSISTVLGASYIYDAFTYKQIPIYLKSNSDKEIAILKGVAGGVFFMFGIATIVKGVKLKKQNKLKIGLTNNGLGLFYNFTS